MDEVIENEPIEEKPKRTRRKKVEQEQVEVEPIEPVEPVEPVEPKPKPKTRKPKSYRARVTAGLLNVRENPSKASATIGNPLAANTIVEIVENVNEWGKLAGQGYVMLQYVERID